MSPNAGTLTRILAVVAALGIALATAPMPAAAATPKAQQEEAAALSRLAAKRAESGEFAKAAEMFHEAYRIDAGYPGYLYSAARAEEKAGMLAEAERDYTKFIDVAPKGHPKLGDAAKNLNHVRSLRSTAVTAAEAAKKAASEKAAAESAAAARLAEERAAADRIAAEKAKAQRDAAERAAAEKAAAEKAAAERIAAEKAKAQRDAAERAAAEKAAAEKAAAEKAKAQRDAAERAAAEKAAAAKEAADQAQAAKKAEADRERREKAESEARAAARADLDRRARAQAALERRNRDRQKLEEHSGGATGPKAEPGITAADERDNGATAWYIGGGAAAVVAIGLAAWAQSDAADLAASYEVKDSSGAITGVTYDDAAAQTRSIHARAYTAAGVGVVGVGLFIVGVVKAMGGKSIACLPAGDGAALAWRF